MITSGAYASNAVCTWTISRPGSPITLTFTSFLLETGYDFVSVFDGLSDSFPALGVLTGVQVPSSVTSVSGAMHIKLMSDGSVSGAGFSASYRTELFAG